MSTNAVAVTASNGRVSAATFARRRFVVAAALFVVVVFGAVFAGRAAAGDDNAQPRIVIVHAGETLSSIAARELPNVPSADAVFLIQSANNLNSLHVQSGQRLSMPRAS